MKTKVSKLRSRLEKEKSIYHDSNLILIPDFLDTKKDLKIWDSFYNINVLYLDLITDYVMCEKELSVFVEDYAYISFKLKEECKDDSLFLTLMIMTYDNFEELKVFSIVNEFYEGAANLKKFEKLIERD